MNELPDIKTSSDVLLEKLIKKYPDKPYDLFNFMFEMPSYRYDPVKLAPEVRDKYENVPYTDYLTKTENFLLNLHNVVPRIIYHKFTFSIIYNDKKLMNLPEETPEQAERSLNYLGKFSNRSEFSPTMSTILPCFSIYNIFNKKNLRCLSFFNDITKQAIYSLETWREKNIGLDLRDEYVMYDCTDSYRLRDDNTEELKYSERFFRKLKIKPYKHIKSKSTFCDKSEKDKIRNLGKFDFIEVNFNMYIWTQRYETKWRETHSLVSILPILKDILDKDGLFIYKINGYFITIIRDIFYLLSLLFDEVKYINSSLNFSTLNFSYIFCNKFKPPNKETQNLLDQVASYYTEKYPDCGSGVIPNKSSYLYKLLNIPDDILLKYDDVLGKVLYKVLMCIIKYRNNFYDKLPLYYSNRDNMNKFINEYKSNIIYYVYRSGLVPNSFVTFNKKDVNNLITIIFKSKSLHVPLLEKIDMCRASSYTRYTKNVIEDIKNLGTELFITKRELDLLDLTKYDLINVVCRPSNFIKYMIKKKYNISVSQAFLKMLEMLYDFPIINSKNIKVFHLCEAPGQFILSFDSYCNKKNIKYDWKAQSLNFNNEEINKKYPGVLDDKYNLIRNYPDHWLFGVKDSKGNLGTGDITDLDNIFDYAKQKYDIVTSDCGLSVTDDNYGKQEEVMNFINYSQFLTAILCLNKNGNYIYKTFLPLSTNISISIICFLHDNFEDLFILKPTLNPASSEVYIFAKNFNGISDKEKDKLINLHKNFSEKDYFHMNNSIMGDLYNAINTCVFENISALKRNIILYHINFNEDDSIVKKLKDFNEKQAYNFVNKYLPNNNFSLVKSFNKHDKSRKNQ